MPATLNDIADVVATELGLGKEAAREAAARIFEGIMASVARGEPVNIRGFGTFVTHWQRARDGRNPQTGEKMHIAAKWKIHWAPSTVLKERLNDLMPQPPGEVINRRTKQRA